MNFSLLDDVADSNLSSTQRLIMFMLLKYANEKNEAWPSQETLASKTGLTRRAIVQNLSLLECSGWINRNHKAGRGHFYMIKKPIKITSSIVNVVHNEYAEIVESNVNVVPSNVNVVPSNVNVVPSNVNVVPTNYQEQPRTTNEQPIVVDRPIRKRKPRPELEPIELPFDSPEFAESWNEWIEFRKEIKKPVTPISRKAQFKRFEKWGESQSMEAIENSISNQWQGLFQPKESKMNSVNNNGSPAQNFKL